jgi:hypothetical protein
MERSHDGDEGIGVLQRKECHQITNGGVQQPGSVGLLRDSSLPQGMARPQVALELASTDLPLICQIILKIFNPWNR